MHIISYDYYVSYLQYTGSLSWRPRSDASALLPRETGTRMDSKGSSLPTTPRPFGEAVHIQLRVAHIQCSQREMSYSIRCTSPSSRVWLKSKTNVNLRCYLSMLLRPPHPLGECPSHQWWRGRKLTHDLPNIIHQSLGQHPGRRGSQRRFFPLHAMECPLSNVVSLLTYLVELLSTPLDLNTCTP